MDAVSSQSVPDERVPHTKIQIAEKLNLTPSQIAALTRKRKLPVISLGYRTKRWDLAACRAAMAKLVVKAI